MSTGKSISAQQGDQTVWVRFSRGEWAIHFFCFSILLASIYELTLGFGMNRRQFDNMAWFAQIVAFNGLHVAFSFVNLMMIPEHRKVICEHFKFNYKKQLLFLLAVLGLFLLGHDRGYFKEFGPSRFIVIAMLLYFPVWHGKKQSMGLSLLLNTRFQKLLQEKGIVFKGNDSLSRRLEHTGVHFFIASIFFWGASFYPKELFITWLPKNWLLAASGLCYFTGLGLIIFSILQLKHRNLVIQKFIFSARYAIGFFVPLSNFAVLGVRGIHGLEYLEIQSKVFQRSRVRQSLFYFYLALCLALLTVRYTMEYPYGQFGYKNLGASDLTSILIILGATTSFFHYYVDSIVFRMKDPVVREDILPLLLEEKAVSSASVEKIVS